MNIVLLESGLFITFMMLLGQLQWMCIYTCLIIIPQTNVIKMLMMQFFLCCDVSTKTILHGHLITGFNIPAGNTGCPKTDFTHLQMKITDYLNINAILLKRHQVLQHLFNLRSQGYFSTATSQPSKECLYVYFHKFMKIGRTG